ncbi:MAG: hypothetical protein GX136_07110 [Clostridiales bacterium]|jgi:hypothetical protein|nr:hypothetical protein [Clostridiales bacterium]
MGRGRTNDTPDFDAYLNGHILSDDDFYSLPEEVQEQVNAHADEFRSQAEMRAFIRDLMNRA